MASQIRASRFPPVGTDLLLVLILAAVVWIILDALHGARPGSAIGDRGPPRASHDKAVEKIWIGPKYG